MPSFNAYDLGFIFEMNTFPAPVARKVTAYPGVDGLEVKEMGSRGGTTIVVAALGHPTVEGLGSLIQGMRTLQVSKVESILVDLFGVSWPNVKLEQFTPGGRVYTCAAGLYQRYQAQFLHRT